MCTGYWLCICTNYRPERSAYCTGYTKFCIRESQSRVRLALSSTRYGTSLLDHTCMQWRNRLIAKDLRSRCVQCSCEGEGHDGRPSHLRCFCISLHHRIIDPSTILRPLAPLAASRHRQHALPHVIRRVHIKRQRRPGILSAVVLHLNDVDLQHLGVGIAGRNEMVKRDAIVINLATTSQQTSAESQPSTH